MNLTNKRRDNHNVRIETTLKAKVFHKHQPYCRINLQKLQKVLHLYQNTIQHEGN